MTRRSFALRLAAAPAVTPSRPKPNVLFIAADDMNTALGCYGNPLVRTPNIDRLAARGVRFHRAYCQFPLCGPSRASLLTGSRPDTTRVLGNNIDFRDFLPNAVTLPQLFKNNGWAALREGKMFHMNVPGEVTSNKYQDPASWTHSSSPGGSEAKTPGEGRRLNPPGRAQGMQWISSATADGQSDLNAADRAIALLESHRDRPFFLGLGFLRPHLPFVAPSKFFDLYPLDRVQLPPNPAGDLDDVPAAAKGVRPYLWDHMGMDEPRIREALRGYYASTSFMDEQLGRVLDRLDTLGLARNTIVVFWGDHGWSLGEHTHWQKMALTEEVARAPLIVAAPGYAKGKVANGLVEFVDIYPTLAALAGLAPPSTLAGQSFEPLLRRPERAGKPAAFTQIEFESIRGRSVRTDRYRYTAWEGSGGGEELYDHQRDPGEFRNLAVSGEAERELVRHREILKAAKGLAKN